MTETLETIDWDQWRSSYPYMGSAEQTAFYDRVHEMHPEQARYSVRALRALLDHIRGPVSVVELGGWDGGFAAEMLAEDLRISRWVNHEISAAAVRACVCTDKRYYGVALDRWYWETVHEADVFVASHVLEHLTFADVRRVFDATDACWWFLQAPLADGPTDWNGYRGSHILEAGWQELFDELAGRDIYLIPELTMPNVRCFRSRL